MPKAAARWRSTCALLIDQRAAPPRRGGAQGRRRPGRAADADRQGLPHRQRPASPPSPACRSSAATATSSEWGMEQFVRDARINMIYEGTNTIQSLDLLGRKVLGDNGAKLKKFGKLVGAVRRGRRRQRGDAGVRQPAGRPGRQGHQADHRARHEGVPEPRRGGRRGGGLPARGRPPGVRLLLGAHGARSRWRSRTRGDPFYAAKLRDGALLLRQAAARDGGADPQRARRRWRR